MKINVSVGVVILLIICSGIFIEMENRRAGRIFVEERWSGWRDPNLSESEQISLRQLEDDIKSITIDAIEFDGLPFSEALSFLENEITKNGEDIAPIEFEVDSSASMGTPISLRLSDVPMAETLRYVTSLNQCGYETLPGRLIFIGDLMAIDKIRHRNESGIFYVPAQIYPALTKPGPHDLKLELTAAGISFRSEDEALFYPEKNHVRASLPRDQMQLLDAYYGTICYIPEPTLFEKIRDKAYSIVGYDPYALPATTATGPTLVPNPSTDPFADPFLPKHVPFSGGRASGPDPFGDQ